VRNISYLCVLALLVAVPSRAMEPERRDAVVVAGRVWDGFAFKDMFLPSQMSTLHLMGGSDSAITFVETREYYWPLSRQVYVDFDGKRDELGGELRITRNGRLVATVLPASYATVFPKGAVNGDARLLWGDDAAAAFDTYEEEERSFARRYEEASKRRGDYERKLVQTGAARMQGQTAPVIQPPEPLPEPNLRLVTKPVPAYRIALGPGEYDMMLYEAGKPVVDTARHLQVLDLSQRATLVGEVVPEERWTRPIPSNTDSQRIFVRPGSTFYLTLFDADRFDESEYIPVVSPQSDAVVGRQTFVRRKPSEVTAVETRFGPDEREVALSRLKVEQTSGAGFGYRVRAVRNAEKEDITAFAITVPPVGQHARGHVTSGVDGDRTFNREIVVVQPRRDGLALGLALLPFLGWLGFRITRRQGSRSVD